MKHTKEEILDALKVIKDTCNEVGEKLEGCDNCPFYANKECVIMCRGPDKWELNFEGAIWRAFKC